MDILPFFAEISDSAMRQGIDVPRPRSPSAKCRQGGGERCDAHVPIMAHHFVVLALFHFCRNAPRKEGVLYRPLHIWHAPAHPWAIHRNGIKIPAIFFPSKNPSFFSFFSLRVLPLMPCRPDVKLLGKGIARLTAKSSRESEGKIKKKVFLKICAFI